MAWNNNHLLYCSAVGWTGFSWTLFPSSQGCQNSACHHCRARGSSIFSGAGRRSHSDISPSFKGLTSLGQAYLRVISFLLTQLLNNQIMGVVFHHFTGLPTVGREGECTRVWLIGGLRILPPISWDFPPFLWEGKYMCICWQPPGC